MSYTNSRLDNTAQTLHIFHTVGDVSDSLTDSNRLVNTR